MNEPIETIEYKNYKIEVYQDNEPTNPRTEWDNFGHMICFHRRYELGDKHNMNIEEVKELIQQKNIVSLNLYLYDHSGITMKAGKTNPFYGHLPQGHAEFDSGQVGIIYVSHEEIKKEFSAKRITSKLIPRAIDILLQEVKTYDEYLTGDVYGFQIKDDEENDIDFCWGFFGDTNYMVNECKSIIDGLVLVPNYQI